ncbi:MAG: hypothetical protein R3220_12675 [Balneolaceae bacterium]|nr:hypothetical protein [Balneolaceae bacterium]
MILIGLSVYVFGIGDAFIPQEGAMFSASENPDAFADLVTTDNYKIWAARGLIGIPLEVIGTIALFLGLVGTSKEKLGFWGMIFCVLGDLFGLSMFILAYYIFPEVGGLITAGVESAASVAAVEPMMPLFGAGFVITFFGLILFAVAVWHAAERFPKWSGILVFVGFALLLIQTSYTIQILANVIWGSAYLWMAIYSWKRFS